MHVCFLQLGEGEHHLRGSGGITHCRQQIHAGELMTSTGLECEVEMNWNALWRWTKPLDGSIWQSACRICILWFA